jgi:hypothetical protein
MGFNEIPNACNCYTIHVLINPNKDLQACGGNGCKSPIFRDRNCTIIWIIVGLGGWRGKWDHLGFFIEEQKVSPFKLSKRLNLKHCFTIQFKTLVCLKQVIQHTFLNVHKNYFIFTPFFKEKFLMITFVMFEKTQE